MSRRSVYRIEDVGIEQVEALKHFRQEDCLFVKLPAEIRLDQLNASGLSDIAFILYVSSRVALDKVAQRDPRASNHVAIIDLRRHTGHCSASLDYEYLLALWRSRNTDSGQRKGWSGACRATRPRPAPELRSTGDGRRARSVHLSSQKIPG
jgi:hypothetical protein